MEMQPDEITKLYFRGLKRGESLMPCDCATIIGKRRLKKFGRAECARVVVEIMERCGFYCDLDEAKTAL